MVGRPHCNNGRYLCFDILFVKSLLLPAVTYINRLIKGVNGRDCEFEDPCLNGGGCQHDCQAVGSLAVCSCYDGFQLDHDDKTCADLNECEMQQGRECAGSCINTEGSFYCSCPPGYELGNDGFKCYRVVMELISRKRVSRKCSFSFIY